MVPIDDTVLREPARAAVASPPAETWCGLRRSVLGTLPEKTLTRLTRDAMRLEIPTAAVLFHEGAPASILLTLSGLIRIFLTSSSGRQSTVRYAKTGDLIGTPTLFVPHHRAGAQALTASVVLALNVTTVRRVAADDRRVALAFGADLAAQMQQYLDQLYGTAFGNLRQRVIRHLFEMAGQQGPHLVAPLSQQNLADAVGSVREVVARVLQALRREQLVATTPDGIALLDPVRLHAEAWSQEL